MQSKISSFTIRTDWSHIDLLGHVNNVSFYTFIQSSRVNFWEQLGLDVTKTENPCGVMLASCACTFIKPVFYHDTITIHSSINFIKQTSFGFHHQLFNQKNELVAEANDVMVLFNFKQNEKVTIDDELKEKMKGYVS
jgi:acyl-CoA thioester hydrolase